MSTIRRRPRSLASRLARLERKFARLEAAQYPAPPVYVSVYPATNPTVASTYFPSATAATATMPWSAIVTFDGTAGYTTIIDATATATNANPIIFNTHD